MAHSEWETIERGDRLVERGGTEFDVIDRKMPETP